MSFLFFATGIVLWLAVNLGLGVLLKSLAMPLIPTFFAMFCFMAGSGILTQIGLVRLARVWGLW
jgi:hypothetical protein